MKLIKQEEKWTCGITSLAMLLDTTVDELILELGHNGAIRCWPDLEEPHCYRGFHIQEFVDICWNRGYALLEIQAIPIQISKDPSKGVRLFDDLTAENRMVRYMDGNKGIIIGQVESGARHACAWDGERIYDPMGFVYRFDSDKPEIRDTDKDFYPIAVAEFLMLKRVIP